VTSRAKQLPRSSASHIRRFGIYFVGTTNYFERWRTCTGGVPHCFVDGWRWMDVVDEMPDAGRDVRPHFSQSAHRAPCTLACAGCRPKHSQMRELVVIPILVLFTSALALPRSCAGCTWTIPRPFFDQKSLQTLRVSQTSDSPAPRTADRGRERHGGLDDTRTNRCLFGCLGNGAAPDHPSDAMPQTRRSINRVSTLIMTGGVGNPFRRARQTVTCVQPVAKQQSADGWEAHTK
jgi:hypothetical protein